MGSAFSQRHTRGRSAGEALLLIAALLLFASGCTAGAIASPSPGTRSAEQKLAAPQLPADAAAQSAIYPMFTVLPTYPVDAYITSQVDGTYNWPYDQFDREAYLLDQPEPVNRLYRLIVLENEVLRLFILPELGGRIWQVVHKPSGHVAFYQNSVVKPSPWGPANQKGWTGLGGLEWNLPVVEHGYDWGTPWVVRTFHDEDGTAVAEISTPDDGRYLSATIEVRLPPDAAYFELIPYIYNNSDAPLDFDYWHNAMLAPGSGNHPSSELRFLLPSEAVRIHSTGDPRLPGPDSVIPWPVYRTRDLSRLGEWDQYLGVFEYPAAHGSFAGVYEPLADTGVVRIYPAHVARGSKIFGLGWDDALTSEYYTDDGSSYVELHGGIAPTFSDRAHLDADESVSWRERWYPVHGIGEFATASESGALSWEATGNTVTYQYYPTTSFAGQLVVRLPDGEEIARQPIDVRAGVTVSGELDVPLSSTDATQTAGATIAVLGADGLPVLSSTIDHS